MNKLDISCQNLCTIAPKRLKLIIDAIDDINSSENQLTPDNFAAFKNLQRLNLSFNQLHEIKPTVCSLKNLVYLDLSYNFLSSATGVENLGLLDNLEYLRLTGNGITHMPSALIEPAKNETGSLKIRFKKLEFLYLDDNKLFDPEDLATLANFPTLRCLYLAKNNFARIPLLGPARKGKRVLKTEDRRKQNNFYYLSTQTTKNEDNYISRDEKLPPPLNTGPSYTVPFSQTYDGMRNKNVRVLDEFFGEKDIHRLFQLRKQYSPIQSVSPRRRPNQNSRSNNIFRNNTIHLIHDLGPTTVEQRNKSYEIVPPFPALEQFDISKNQIHFESNLLAVAVWPKLRELMVYGNPVVSNWSALPAQLDRLLVKQLNINVRHHPLDYAQLNVDEGISSKPLESTPGSKFANKAFSPQALEPSDCLDTKPTKFTLADMHPRIPVKKPSRQFKPYPLTGTFVPCNAQKTLHTFQLELKSGRLSDSGCVAPHVHMEQSSRGDFLVSNKEELQSDGGEGLTPNDANKLDVTQDSWEEPTAISKTPNENTTYIGTQPLPSTDAELGDGTNACESDRARSDLGPILPDLAWIVDEANLPESIQECLKELRDWRLKSVEGNVTSATQTDSQHVIPINTHTLPQPWNRNPDNRRTRLSPKMSTTSVLQVRLTEPRQTR